MGWVYMQERLQITHPLFRTEKHFNIRILHFQSQNLRARKSQSDIARCPATKLEHPVHKSTNNVDLPELPPKPLNPPSPLPQNRGAPHNAKYNVCKVLCPTTEQLVSQKVW